LIEGTLPTAPRSPITNLAFYLFVSMLLFGLPVLAHPASAHVGNSDDAPIMMWSLVWWPYALAHWTNPFITHAIWAPSGYNLTWATSIPGLAVVFAPITMACGPVVSYNIAAIMAPALSAWSAFLLCHRITRNPGAALAGGLLYGFSPYEVGQVYAAHLHMSAIFVPPLCVFLTLLLFDDAITHCSFSASFAFLLVVQCLVSTEVLATMILFGSCALLTAFFLMPAYRPRLIGAILPMGWAFVAAAIMLAPFLYFLLAGNAVPKEPIIPATYFSADVLSFVVPGPLVAIAPRPAARLTELFVGNFWENGTYISLPLLAVVGFYFWARRRNPGVRFLVVLLVMVTVAAMGPVLRVGGHAVVGLPWALAERLPLIKHALPIRFGNYEFLIMAIVLSFWLSLPRTAYKTSLALAVVAALAPNFSLFVRVGRYQTPEFFARGLYAKYLHRGDNVLVIPYGEDGLSMAWQAESRLYFRMAGGYIGTTPEEFRRWPVVNTLLTSLSVPDPAAQLRAFVSAHGIDSIAVVGQTDGAASRLVASLGVPSVRVGGVSLYRLPRTNSDAAPVRSLGALESDAIESWFTELVCAAYRFRAKGRDLALLSPATAYAMGLLPDSRWTDSLGWAVAGERHGTTNGLWVGPGDNGTIGVGLFASRNAIMSLLSRYVSDTFSVLYPYPDQYSTDGQYDDNVHFLLMNMRPVVLNHCAVAMPNEWSDRPPR
jgi:hypothetical protein